MNAPQNEIPKGPIPGAPARPQPEQPMVSVYEKPSWEYRVIARKASDPLPSEDDLNAMGESGWELVGVVAVPDAVSF